MNGALRILSFVALLATCGHAVQLASVQLASRLAPEKLHGNFSGNFSGNQSKWSETVFMHFHMPKTGGTVVSNMLVSNVCGEDMLNQGWESHCTRPCGSALVDTELACAQGAENLPRHEHGLFDYTQLRAQRLAAAHEAKSVLYVTTLRPGWQRVISQWAMEVELRWWLPPEQIPPMSNESLLLYITGGIHAGEGSEFSEITQFPSRNNIQVSELASVPSGFPVVDEHFEKAKIILTQRPWLVGFADCLDIFQQRLATIGGRSNIEMPNPLESHTPKNLILSEQVLDVLRENTKYDNQLYDWALMMSQEMGGRFVGPCGESNLVAQHWMTDLVGNDKKGPRGAVGVQYYDI